MAKRVLIVDDAPFIRELLSNIIYKLGHTVIGEAINGKEAVIKAMDLRPDLIFLDLVMPEKNGIEVAQEITANFPQIKIVACSTLEQESMKDRAFEAGCIDYIVKPFKIEDVRRCLNL